MAMNKLYKFIEYLSNHIWPAVPGGGRHSKWE